uniref:Uncharacterized protein n=1 Tax=Cucumis melo TaxID=3656 RepID=A0A9I9E4J4_CUCME
MACDKSKEAESRLGLEEGILVSIIFRRSLNSTSSIKLIVRRSEPEEKLRFATVLLLFVLCIIVVFAMKLVSVIHSSSNERIEV